MNPQNPGRLTYLDQFRGYTVFGMIVVNYLGAFHQQIHPIFHHHNTYCSYPDTIMPQFFFAVGFALRLTTVRRLEREGWLPAHLRLVRRVLGLLLIAALVHGFDRVGMNWNTLQEKGVLEWIKQTCSREFFQTLTHIAVTTLWVIPVIGSKWPVRMIWLVASAALHIVLSQDFYLHFALHRPVIDGGPLGFLTWTIPVLAGSFACDFLTQPVVKGAVVKLLVVAALVMALGYGFSCINYPSSHPALADDRFVLAAPPFMPPYDPMRPNASYEDRHLLQINDVVGLWTMSQRTGSVSYLTFSTGFSLFVLALCMMIFKDGREIGIFRSLGSNALIAYIIHGMAIDALMKVMPKDGPLWFVLVGLTLVMCITWLVCWWLEKKGWYVRV